MREPGETRRRGWSPDVFFFRLSVSLTNHRRLCSIVFCFPHEADRDLESKFAILKTNLWEVQRGRLELCVVRWSNS